MSLRVPDVEPDDDMIRAALAYAAAGWHVLPVRQAVEHAGSVLGKGWPAKSTRDADQIAAWLAGTDYALALHVGRSGAVVFDVDDPDQLPDVLAGALEQTRPPYQSTRDGAPGRGHYLFGCPPGRQLGNGTGKLRGGWGEVRGRNGIVLVAPSTHEKAAAGGRYLWQRTGAVPVLPPMLAELLPDALAADDAATDADVRAFLAEHVGNTRPAALKGPLRWFAEKVAAGESRHVTAVDATIWGLKEARAGYYPAAAVVEQISAAFGEALRGERPSEYGGIVAWAVSQAKAADLDEVRTIADREQRSADPTDLITPPTNSTMSLVEFVAQLRGWLDLPDPGHVLLTLAAAATRDLDGEALWLLLVAPPSSGKTEDINMLDVLADDRLNEVTAAGLLGWGRKGRTPVPTGVLTRVGPVGLVTFGDLSSLLATSDSGRQAATFSLLRRVYDGGPAGRDIQPPGGNAPEGVRLSWSGRLTVIAAVTGAIDRFSVHDDELGPRWVYCRLPGRDTEAKRRAARLARRGGLAEHRAAAREAAAKLVSDARGRIAAAALSDELADAVEDAALVTCWGRASVPRHGYGRREVDGTAKIEEPPRVIRQLHALGRGLLALGVPAEHVAILLRQVALDSMPEPRRAVLGTLALGEALTTAALGRAAGLHRHVARMAAEELEVVGIVRGAREGADDPRDEVDRRAVTWELDGDDGDLIAEVFAANTRDVGWHEIYVPHLPHPQ